MRVTAAALGVLLGTALLTGCVGEGAPEFDAADYRAGDCGAAAEPVFEIREAVRPVAEDGAAPDDAVGALKTEQTRLIEVVRDMDDAGTRAAAQRVVDTVGFYRIGVDAKNFTPKLAKDVETAAEALLSACSA